MFQTWAITRDQSQRGMKMMLNSSGNYTKKHNNGGLRWAAASLNAVLKKSANWRVANANDKCALTQGRRWWYCWVSSFNSGLLSPACPSLPSAWTVWVFLLETTVDNITWHLHARARECSPNTVISMLQANPFQASIRVRSSSGCTSRVWVAQSVLSLLPRTHVEQVAR